MRRPGGVGLAKLVDRVGRDRETAAHQVVQQDAQAVEIRLLVRRGAVQYLGRHVQGRSAQPDHRIDADVPRRRGTEIHEHDPAARRPHHVLRLDVAVNQPRAVDRGERAAQVQRHEHRLLRAERTPLGDDVLQRPALYQFHPQAHAAVGLVGVVHHDDV